MRTIATTLALCALLWTPVPALAYEGEDEHTRGAIARTRDVIADIFIARPLALGQLAVGAVVYVVAFPVDLIMDEDLDSTRVCIADPWDQLVTRPLGDL
jgi:hypothetical protein